ncbi:hypothetical protein [Nonomuraea wenchangensis]|uniref:Uncharacterized protein n=1 Tax=Nonomuraea wenchangensis TaxID=568860 RepID=A0A1I0F3L2_9ACTN|nr:hypothetical protein [Nonomuraea wenchangensis]SET52493.1 hypothetical protein SAMN05421811_103309 [Nonomuraea wenchangensis]
MSTAELTIRIAADLEVGDTYHREPGYSVVVTELNPPTREAAMAHGEREVWSGGMWWTLLAVERVDATPSDRRVAAHLAAEQDGGVA